MKPISLLHLSVLAVASATLLPSDVIAGHKRVSPPRPESIKSRVLMSPNEKLRAVVLFPGDESPEYLNDYENRVIIRCNSRPCEPVPGTARSAGEILASQDIVGVGINGYYVSREKWSPDSPILRLQLGVFGRPVALAPHPIGVYSRQENRFATVDDMIGSPHRAVSPFDP
jgi:hypothetical protein